MHACHLMTGYLAAGVQQLVLRWHAMFSQASLARVLATSSCLCSPCAVFVLLLPLPLLHADGWRHPGSVSH